jgi:hypothetical protein
LRDRTREPRRELTYIPDPDPTEPVAVFIYGINLSPKDIKDQAGNVIQTESRTDFQFSIGTTF